MRAIRFGLASLFLFFAGIAAADTGPVQVSNTTGIPVTVHVTKYVDTDGEEHTADLTWKFDAGETEKTLEVDGQPLVAQKVNVTFTTSDGDDAWVYTLGDSSDHVLMRISYAELKRGDAPVSFTNDTQQNVRCTLVSFSDISGKETALKPNPIDFAANQTIPMRLGDDAMTASSVKFCLETSDGAHIWHSDYAGGDGFPIHFTDDLLARQHQAVIDAKAAAIVKLIGAYAADAAANHALGKDDMNFGDLLVAVGGKYARSKLIDSAVDDVFPAFNDGEKQQASRVINLIFDGQLNADNLHTAESRDAFIKQLSDSNVDAGRAAELCNFVWDLAVQRQKQQDTKGGQ